MRLNGMVLAQLGRLDEAEQNLRVAVDLYRTLELTAEAAQAADDLNDLITGARQITKRAADLHSSAAATPSATI
jgi:hypothetical protein